MLRLKLSFHAAKHRTSATICQNSLIRRSVASCLTSFVFGCETTCISLRQVTEMTWWLFILDMNYISSGNRTGMPHTSVDLKTIIN
jgi:hypothetical protein